ncbi:MAG: M23 family metallopeptidase [Balneolaceae bacterium]
MWDFFKKIFSRRDGDVTVMVLDDDEPEQSSSFSFRSSDILRLALVVVAVSVFLTTLIFFITPIGSMYQYQQDESLRQEILSVTEKVFALSDSLDARDKQLLDLKQILVETPDTLFSTDFVNQGLERPVASSGFSGPGSEKPAYKMLSRDEIIFSDILKDAPVFPASYPIEGTLSQRFSADDTHFGIDIAAREHSEFRAIADGTVVNAGWTVKYGYVIYLQHGDGYMSVYKHGAQLFKQDGDIVLRGDILGTAGDKGALSFGSHLHLEIWKNGVAQDPQMYLIR